MFLFIPLRYPQCAVHYFPRPSCIIPDRVNQDADQGFSDDRLELLGGRWEELDPPPCNSELELGSGSPQPATVLGVVANHQLVAKAGSREIGRLVYISLGGSS